MNPLDFADSAIRLLSAKFSKIYRVLERAASIFLVKFILQKFLWGTTKVREWDFVPEIQSVCHLGEFSITQTSELEKNRVAQFRSFRKRSFRYEIESFASSFHPEVPTDRACPYLMRNLRVGGNYRSSIRAARAGNVARSSLDDNASICSNS